jgi:hypothetical protein
VLDEALRDALALPGDGLDGVQRLTQQHEHTLAHGSGGVHSRADPHGLTYKTLVKGGNLVELSTGGLLGANQLGIGKQVSQLVNSIGIALNLLRHSGLGSSRSLVLGLFRLLLSLLGKSLQLSLARALRLLIFRGNNRLGGWNKLRHGQIDQK